MKYSTPKQHTPFMLPLVISLVVFAGEVALLYLFAKGRLPLPLFMVGHLAISLALALWPILADMFRKDIKFPLLFLMLTLTMGVFGAGVCVATTLLYAWYARHSVSFAEWYVSLFPEDSMSHQNAIYERLALGWEDFSEKSGMVPYMDVITLGSEKQKQMALEKITRHFTPELSPVLIKALDDPKNSIRVQAATILTKLEQGYAQTALNLEKKIHKQPSNARNPALILQLARHYDNFAHAGFILDKDREQTLRNKAIAMYDRYLEWIPDDEEAQFFLGCLYLKNGNLKEAHALLKHCVEGEQEQAPVKIWYYMECLYRMHDFDTLKQVAKTHFPRMDTDDPDVFKVVEMVRLWGGGIVSC